jgi:hypothetical protein
MNRYIVSHLSPASHAFVTLLAQILVVGVTIMAAIIQRRLNHSGSFQLAVGLVPAPAAAELSRRPRKF